MPILCGAQDYSTSAVLDVVFSEHCFLDKKKSFLRSFSNITLFIKSMLTPTSQSELLLLFPLCRYSTKLYRTSQEKVVLNEKRKIHNKKKEKEKSMNNNE